MKKKHKSRMKSRGARIITTVSVALVLTVIGLVTMMSRVADNVANSLRANIGLVVVVADEATPQQVDSLKLKLKQSAWVAQTTYTSAEEVNARMISDLGDADLADINPFQAEYTVKVKPQWTSADSLQSLARQLKRMSAVYEVGVHAEMVRNVNQTVNTVMIVLLVVAAAMLIISFVLIFNTVSMDVYTHRMVIHTMQYVGATRGFIMRPYIIRSIVNGIIAAAVAVALLSGLLAWGQTVYPVLMNYINWIDMALLAGALTLTGALICGVATWIAALKYLRRNIDEIYEN
ncbi:MAG: permease-like cell division protein FtsX [Bacteroides sp.]|nr:permease-like cell division protein FtsX [Bacteroides sp.]MCM1413628.1 permease-like cell division protein FtsX [Bacteroides sp.]MCM1471155.1 permease-like cell division protein FtsX [Bacteroides sp.]